jgi:hypothetical protein
MSVDSLREGTFVSIKAWVGKYICSIPNGGINYVPVAKEWERLQLIRKGKRKWAFLNCRGLYLSAVDQEFVQFAATTPLRRESFVIDGSLSHATLYSKFHRRYLSAQRDTKLECNRQNPLEWEHFVIEICNR